MATTTRSNEREPLAARPFPDESSAPRTEDVTQRSAVAADPSPSEVAQRAYTLYSERGFEDGHDQDDWFRAERELRER
jgi:hypothetical protein